METLKLSPWILGFLGASVRSAVAGDEPARARVRRLVVLAGRRRSSSPAVEIVFVDNPGPTVTAIVRIEYAGRGAVRVADPRAGHADRSACLRARCSSGSRRRPRPSTGSRSRPRACAWTARPRACGRCGRRRGRRAERPDDGAQPVAVIEQGSVGPYDYVTIAVDPTPRRSGRGRDRLAHEQRLRADRPRRRRCSARTCADGLNLLAFKLTSDADAGAIRPVMLTYESERPVIPLRPAAVAAQDDMGIQVWVIGPSQAVPDNYKLARAQRRADRLAERPEVSRPARCRRAAPVRSAPTSARRATTTPS